MKKILLMCALSLPAFSSSIDAPQGYERARAESVLKDADLALDRSLLLDSFRRVMFEPVYKNFESFVETILGEDYPKPIHGNAVILDGWRCLYEKMLKSLTSEDDAEKLEHQQTALANLMYIHRVSLQKFNPDLYTAAVPEGTSACKRCITSSAGRELMAEKKD